MDLHDRYLLFPTIDIPTLQAVRNKFKNENDICVDSLIQFYNHEMTKETLDANKLEICRMLLCYEYQLMFRDIEKRNTKLTADTRTCFRSIEAIFPVQHLRSTTEISILRDIITLQMVLYCNVASIKQRLQDFLAFFNAYIVNSDSRGMFMKVLGYGLESLRLRQFLHKDEYCNKEEFKVLGSTCLDVVKSWIKAKEDSEWGILASMLPMMVNIFTPECILYPLWDHILNEVRDSKEFLIMLSIMADMCLTLSHLEEPTYIHRDIFSNSTFWLRILEGLRSPLQQYRKQALYIMKKATDSFNNIDISNLGLTKAEVTPFICSKIDDSALSMAIVKQKFFLVLEALEEKQYHLVAPAVTHITSLERANREHRSCKCFNIVWLQCIFEKVLQHENSNIVKWGVSRVCELNDIACNDQFLKLLLTVLNNSYIYECQPNEDSPEVVKSLSTFLGAAEKNTNLLRRFLKAASEMAWGPVAIFYIMHTLRVISHERTQRDYWQATELEAVKSLVETNLSMHSHVLRVASQIELLRAIPGYVPKIDDLMSLANVLAAFPTGEGLAREKPTWSVIAKWLQRILTKKDAITFIEDSCTRYLCENVSLKVDPRAFALMVFLLHDANFILSCKACPARKALCNWLSSLNDIERRPYADIHSSTDVAEFMSHLLCFVAADESNGVTCLISLYVDATFKFLLNLRTMVAEMTYEDYVKYTAILSLHIVNMPKIKPRMDMNDYAEKLQSEGIRLLKGTSSYPSYLYGLSTLHLSQDISVLPQARNFYTECLLNADTITAPVSNRSDNVHLQGKIVSKYYLLLSKLMRQYLTSTPARSWISTLTLLTNLSRFLTSSGTEIVSEVATILTVMIDNGAIRDANETEALQQFFRLCWRWTLVSEKNNTFWTAIQSLMRVIVNNNFFLLPGATEFTSTFVNELTEKVDGAPKLKRILLSTMERLDVHNLTKLTEPLLNCLLHGSMPRRDKKVENHTYLFIAEHLRQYYPEHILAMDRNNDAAVRALAAILIHRIISHSEFDYARTVVPLIFEMLEKYRNKRYFNDSNLHKLKHRLMQVLLILEPATSGDVVTFMLEKLCDLISAESNQPSVRLMQEWLMMRIIQRNANLYDKLWTSFAEAIKKRPGCTISIASIVYHVARLLSDNSQRSFIQSALPYVSQCCLGQQFNMRLYNQFILVRLYKLLKINNGDVSPYEGIYQAAVASLQQRSSIKNSIRIEDDFYFSCFHSVNDYSLQTIYSELPRLTNVSRDEWISPDMFKALAFEQNNNHPLQLYNIDSCLADFKTSMYLARFSTGDTETLTSDVETFEGLHNMQKKIDPFRVKISSYGDTLEATRKLINQRDTQLNEEGLIVVASFISRLPNLGGIVRTCEIFGVKALVVANLDCVKDKEFQSLSVTAERWINILQIKPHELQEYLLEKKDAGWSIVAAEQTASSVSLLETKFKKKTVLVLGNEKDGIPANFIPLFNVCVEIPQVGVIRSLNVHVTAAICIWQYASQHILK